MDEAIVLFFLFLFLRLVGQLLVLLLLSFGGLFRLFFGFAFFFGFGRVLGLFRA